MFCDPFDDPQSDTLEITYRITLPVTEKLRVHDSIFMDEVESQLTIAPSLIHEVKALD